MTDGRRGPDPQLLGLGIALVGMVILTLTPPLGGWIEIPQGVARSLLVVGAALLFVGAAVPLVHAWVSRR